MFKLQQCFRKASSLDLRTPSDKNLPRPLANSSISSWQNCFKMANLFPTYLIFFPSASSPWILLQLCWIADISLFRYFCIFLCVLYMPLGNPLKFISIPVIYNLHILVWYLSYLPISCHLAKLYIFSSFNLSSEINPQRHLIIFCCSSLKSPQLKGQDRTRYPRYVQHTMVLLQYFWFKCIHAAVNVAGLSFHDQAAHMGERRVKWVLTRSQRNPGARWDRTGI